MNVNFANTVPTTRADGRNNGNSSRPVNALPRSDNPQRQPVASAAYQLGPRIRQTKQDLDFAIYEDETAHEIPQPRREYYGSNLPALADISSGEEYSYAQHHVWYRSCDRHIRAAARRGNDILKNALIALKRDYDAVPLVQRATGCYEWVIACDPQDVWLWVQDKGYHRRWNKIQKRLFVVLLEWMALIMREVQNSEDDHLMMATVRAKAQLIKQTFESLGLQNLTVEKDGLKVLFIPCGEDKHVIYRRDFTREEQRYIDVLWPEQWAPGNERHLDELLRAADYVV
ncbi:hypothetical protein TGAM01_v204545 [Trichoderma gamsii]|uniref:Uncharacterized protein n=1 Tax=Trichoderma gamsii TaxID=398673 RepID=A0A2P4ZQE8_9HYPO|nr:hypothetical protein TGAM01_v204545 [Trichoderma gamsii]PON26535.1 hypothetical protein TGAM01_v204545 [Trichoderma gamsii]